MRINFVLIFFFRLNHACLPGFYGNECNLCPENHKCLNDIKQSCPYHLMAFPGSRSCYTFSNFSGSQFKILPVKGNAGSKNPSNASCGCFKVNTELSIIFELDELTRIFGIITQGYELTWVKTYFIDASDDNISWTPIGGLFNGNSDDLNVAYTFFPFEIVTKFLKFSVVEYFLWPAVQLSFLTRVVPVQKCKPKVNMQLSNLDNCTYICKNGTYALNAQCISYPKYSMHASNQSVMKVSHFQKPFDSKIHAFNSKVVLQSEKLLPNQVYMRYDQFDWQLINVELMDVIFNPNFYYYQLPVRRINAGIFIKYFNDSKWFSLNYGRPIIHNRTQVSSLQNRVSVTWGIGSAFYNTGDILNLGFISCNNSTLNFYNVSVPFDAVKSEVLCQTNDFSFFEENLELFGIRKIFQDFSRKTCLQKNGTFFIPKTERSQLSNLYVEAYCKH